MTLSQQLGANAEAAILQQRLDVLEAYKTQYLSTMEEINKLENTSAYDLVNYNVPSFKSNLPGFSDGGVVDYTGLAMVHGSKNKPEFVLNNDQMKNMLSNLIRPQTVSNFKTDNNSVVNYNFGNIELPNVKDTQQFVTELKSLVNITKHQ